MAMMMDPPRVEKSWMKPCYRFPEKCVGMSKCFFETCSIFPDILPNFEFELDSSESESTDHGISFELKVLRRRIVRVEGYLKFCFLVYAPSVASSARSIIFE